MVWEAVPRKLRVESPGSKSPLMVNGEVEVERTMVLLLVEKKLQADAPRRLPVPVRVNVPPTRVIVPSPVASPPLTVMLCGPLLLRVVPEPTARSLLILMSEPKVVVPDPEVVKL